jgi:signal transduction histidine kinase
VHEFYSMVSHELRTPLTSVHASLRIMEGGLVGPLSDKVKQLVRIARAESDRLIRLINDILDIRRLEAGMLELKPRELEVVKLVELCLAEMKGMADNAGITLVSDIKWLGVFNADQDRTMQMLDNLLSNAIKFSPSGAEVRVTVEKVEDNVRLTVSDNGPGIAAEQQGKLFHKFQQVDSSDSRPEGGTGLGLAITKAIAEQHGGTVGMESELGKGSKFWIELPIKARLATTRLAPAEPLTERLAEPHGPLTRKM